MRNLSILLLEGTEITVDPKEAARYLKMAVDGGPFDSK